MFEQALYHANIFKEKKQPIYAKHIIRNSFLKNLESPYFIYTGTNSIDFSRIINNAQAINQLKKYDCIDIFLYEPLSYYFKNQKHNLGFYSEFDHKLNISTNLRTNELDSILKLQRKIGKKKYSCKPMRL